MSTSLPDFREYTALVGGRRLSMHTSKDIIEVADTISCECGSTFKYLRHDPSVAGIIYICACRSCKRQIRVSMKAKAPRE